MGAACAKPEKRPADKPIPRNIKRDSSSEVQYLTGNAPGSSEKSEPLEKKRTVRFEEDPE